MPQSHCALHCIQVNLPVISLATEFLNALGCRISSVLASEDREAALFFFSAFLSTFSVSIAYFCTILLLTTIQSCR